MRRRQRNASDHRGRAVGQVEHALARRRQARHRDADHRAVRVGARQAHADVAVFVAARARRRRRRAFLDVRHQTLTFHSRHTSTGSPPINRHRSRRLILIAQRINPLRDPQQPHKRRATIATARHLTCGRLLKQFIEASAFVDHLDDPVRVVTGRDQGRVAGVGLGVADDFGVHGQDFVLFQGQLASVVGRQFDLCALRGDQDFAFEDRIAELELAHGTVFALGENFALDGGNACDGVSGGHA